jgi:hypothetical protein
MSSRSYLGMAEEVDDDKRGEFGFRGAVGFGILAQNTESS